MLVTRTDGSASITLLAALALSSSVISHQFFSPDAELWAEALSWAALPFFFTYAKSRRASPKTVAPFSNVGPQSAPSLSLWAAAVSLTVATLFRAEYGVIRFMPLLTPLLLAALTTSRLEISTLKLRSLRLTAVSETVSTTFRGSVVTAVIATYVVSYQDWQRAAVSTVAIIALLLAYLSFSPRRNLQLQWLSPINNLERAIGSLSLRILVLIVIGFLTQSIMFGLVGSDVYTILMLGMAKTASWFFTVQLSQKTSWLAATAVGTFALLTTRSPSRQASDTYAMWQLAVSVMALGQIVYMIPKSATSRSRLWLFCLLPVAPFLANLLAVKKARSAAKLEFDGTHDHPVEVLYNNAKLEFTTMIQRQSKSYTAAYAEYRRKYKIEPPAGFKAWYEYAKARQSPLIDDFDTIHAGVSPFWKISGEEFQTIMTSTRMTPGSELWSCKISGHQGKMECNHPSRSFDRHFSQLVDIALKDIRDKLPDMEIFFNHLNEPRVVFGARQSSDTSTRLPRPIKLVDLSRQANWREVTQRCATVAGDRDAVEVKINTYGLPFVTNRTTAMDLCLHPEYNNTHGLFMNPTSFKLIPGLTPVLSTGAPSTMDDILIPSPAYIEPQFQYDEKHDVEWSQKRNNLYWAGSTSGGYAIDDQWQNYHRQRFVTLAQDLPQRSRDQRQSFERFYLRRTQSSVVDHDDDDDHGEPAGVSDDELGSLSKRNLETKQKPKTKQRISLTKSTFLDTRRYDVSFTKIHQCDAGPHRAQRLYFPLHSWSPSSTPFRSRLVFDLDGDGISGRYYSLLASRSTVLKQTVLREWHDDRLIPWLHYIPVSMSMQELPELVRFLTSTTNGQDIARDIASRGREWSHRALRKEDMGIYMYRLLLELARLQDSEREARRI